jgi:UDP-hydrolysing UDP-N-acetyl-D-glucosamine 2-epimerase
LPSSTPTADAPRKVCVILVDRANYGRLKPVMAAIQRHPRLTLQVVCAGSMVLERFDLPVREVREDGFPVHGEVHLEVEGSIPVTMAKSVGFGVIEMAGELQRLQPDLVLLIGDRYEALAAAVAAVYMNLPLVHVQGGEVSGSIDESARHAITKLAHFHLPATERARDYLLRMGERPEHILGVGCPSSDIARDLDLTLDPAVVNGRGSGVVIDLDQPFLLSVFHPTTTDYGGERQQMENLLKALHHRALPTLLLWPNIDAGADHISKAIRIFRTQTDAEAGERWLRTLTNLKPEDYLRILARAACAVGNSSSFVRDASYFGTPVVLVGDRQRFRERGAHVLPVAAEATAIEAALGQQLEAGRYPASALYGDGHVAQRLAEALVTLDPYVQKHLAYVDDAADAPDA